MTAWDWSIDGWIVLAGVLSACSCALVGNHLVLRRMSLMGDAISHAVLPGLAVAFLISGSRGPLPMFMGAVIVGGLTTVFSETIRRQGNVEHGAAMGVVFSVLFALGLLLIRQAADHVDLDPGCVLYGNIAQIPLDAIGGELPPAILNLLIVLGIDAVFVALFYKELRITSFDPELATTVGIPAGLMHYALMIMTALTAVASFEAVGSILVIAMLIVPAATARLLTDRLGVMILLSVILSAISAVVGHALAIWGPGWVGFDPTLSVNTSAMMAVVVGVFFAFAVLLSPNEGLAIRAWHRFRLSLQIRREDLLGLLFRWEERIAPAESVPITFKLLISMVGTGVMRRLALLSLRWNRLIAPVNGGGALQLTPRGRNQASRLVRSHRLWESYLAKHFDLPLDHLHMPAERMEHFITPTISEGLEAQLTDPSHDPHGRQIPTSSERTSEPR